MAATSSKRTAAIEILPSQLRLAIVELRGDDERVVTTASVPWRQQSVSLGTDEGRVELTTALKQLAYQYKLASIPVQIALSGDYCVTRAISGLNEQVRRELQDLEQRSSLYLSLGHGTKSAAHCVVPIDARHQRAMLAVVNERVLSALYAALQQVGLETSVIEPSLISLSRLVGQLGADKDHPVLLVHGTEQGVEVGISYCGQLLLDYRPAAREAKENAGAIIGSHLHRLQRYCDRYVKVGGGKLKAVFVSGEPALVEMVQRDLQPVEGLSVSALNAAAHEAHWRIVDEDRAPEFAATLGATLPANGVDGRSASPNLLDRTRTGKRTALLPALVRTLWPVAAMLLIAVTVGVLVQRQYSNFLGLDNQLALLAPQQQEARQLREQILNDQLETANLQRIRERVVSPAWNELATKISHCMPEDVWLDDFRVDAQGRLQLVGASFTEDGVFEFVRWLERFPELKHVALSGTRPTRLDIGPATQFDVRCDFAGATGQGDSNDDNG